MVHWFGVSDIGASGRGRQNESGTVVHSEARRDTLTTERLVVPSVAIVRATKTHQLNKDPLFPFSFGQG